MGDVMCDAGVCRVRCMIGSCVAYGCAMRDQQETPQVKVWPRGSEARGHAGVTEMPVQPHVNQKKTLFFLIPFHPVCFGVFQCFLVFFFWLFSCFCSSFLVSLKYATPTFFTHLPYFDRICQQS